MHSEIVLLYNHQHKVPQPTKKCTLTSFRDGSKRGGCAPPPSSTSASPPPHYPTFDHGLAHTTLQESCTSLCWGGGGAQPPPREILDTLPFLHYKAFGPQPGSRTIPLHANIKMECQLKPECTYLIEVSNLWNVLCQCFGTLCWCSLVADNQEVVSTLQLQYACLIRKGNMGRRYLFRAVCTMYSGTVHPGTDQQYVHSGTD